MVMGVRVRVMGVRVRVMELWFTVLVIMPLL